jgi:hypothetical protein
LTVVAGAVGMVVALVAALVIAKLAGSGTGPSAPAKPASKQVLDHIASVPVRTLNSIGAGSASATPASITAPSLTKDGKPEILYVGAEYCLYCAAERWAVAVALSRFGTLHGVRETASSSQDIYPSTPTLSFPRSHIAQRAGVLRAARVGEQQGGRRSLPTTSAAVTSSPVPASTPECCVAGHTNRSPLPSVTPVRR